MGFHTPQALQLFLNKPPSTPLLDPTIHKGHGCYVVDIRKPLLRDECTVQKPRDSYDDSDSVCTASTASLSSESDDEDDYDRRVSFADNLVTEEWEREVTPKEEIPALFYTTEQMSRFRQEYRLERKLLSELAIDPDCLPVEPEELTSLLDSSARQSGRHRISRVVVLHNDRLETFFSREKPAPCETTEEEEAPPGDDFFDNDSFWSGSITWY